MSVSNIISKIRRKWMFRFWLRNFMVIILGIWAIFIMFNEPILLSLLFILLVSSSVFFFLKDWPTDSRILSLLNSKYPELEFSTSLLMQEVQSGLERIQRKKVEEQLSKLKISLRFPITWKPVLILLIMHLMAASYHWFTYEPPRQNPVLTLEENMTAKEVEPAIIKLKRVGISIKPPSYTGLSTYNSENDIRMPEGSQVRWSVKFSSIPEFAYLHFSNGDSLSLLRNQEMRFVRLSNLDQGFYWVSYFDGQSNQRTPYYKIEVVPDEPPVVEISGIAQYQELPFDPDASMTFTSSAADDYVLSDASIVATVTKGDGESVKFREERLLFKTEVSGKQFSETMTIKASDFDMEPGNELYFYLVAKDNKNPVKQSSRTETFFFVLEDTTNVEFSLVGSLGVDLMPEYFRSQRQIIIDTEKLLAEKDDISPTEFKSRSNALGFDQKTLRIKYGQFLGEESESGIAIENEIDSEELEDLDRKSNPRKLREEHDHKPGENVLEEYGHNHDNEDEEGQLMAKGTEQKTEAEKAIEAIVHNHDDEETATFYEVSLKTKLKTALSEMWDSELYLRLYEPEKSLTYQYAALKLLKEIKNHARIYVQRIGFDPPPITEDGKRLTGDLDEIHAQAFDGYQVDSVSFPAIRKAVLSLSSLTSFQDSVPNVYQQILQSAGNELAAIAIRFPSKYLSELGSISRLVKMDVFDQEALEELDQLQQVFLSLLQSQEVTPIPSRTSSHPLTERVREKLSSPVSRP